MKNRVLLLTTAPERSWTNIVRTAVAPWGELELATVPQALKYAHWPDYRLVIIDAGQPSEARQWLSDIRKTAADLPLIVALTTLQWHVARNLFQSGATDCWSKSASAVEWRTALQELFEHLPPRLIGLSTEDHVMKERVLFVDNDDDFRNTHQEILERAGYLVEAATNPAQARDLFEAGAFDAAILDNRLRDNQNTEDRSGMELARLMAQSLPVILLTDYPDFRDTREVLSGRTNVSYLAKKEGHEAMLKELERLLRRRVFIVHGRDEVLREKVARFIEHLQLQAIILNEQPAAGLTLIEKFEQHSKVGFVIVLLTPDDVGGLRKEPAELKPRARQNVLFELGYFVGKLGRRKVCALYQGDVELPSDYHGVEYLPAQTDGDWHLALARTLKHAGLEVDLNRAV